MDAMPLTQAQPIRRHRSVGHESPAWGAHRLPIGLHRMAAIELETTRTALSQHLHQALERPLAAQLELALGWVLHEARHCFSRIHDPAIRAVIMTAERAMGQLASRETESERIEILRVALNRMEQQLHNPEPSTEAEALTLIDAALYPGACCDYSWERTAQLKQALLDLDRMGVEKQGLARQALSQGHPDEPETDTIARYRTALLEIRDSLL